MGNTNFNKNDIYIVVEWPEVQELMDEPWFQDEAILDVEMKVSGSSSTYFIPAKYLDADFQ